uniref:Uncharacterized protein n=1 Tax=Varanus komodoensis TaxID=61221 RepID=A0A8D2IUB1_VARKO
KIGNIILNTIGVRIKDLTKQTQKDKQLITEVRVQMEEQDKKFKNQMIKIDQVSKSGIEIQDRQQRPNLCLTGYPEDGNENDKLIQSYWIGLNPFFQMSYLQHMILMQCIELAHEELEEKHQENMTSIMIEGYQIQVFPDLCTETLQWRRYMFQDCQILKKNTIIYSWGFPIFGGFSYNGKYYSVDTKEEVLKRTGMPHFIRYPHTQSHTNIF